MIASYYGGGRSEVGSVCNGLEAVLVGDLEIVDCTRKRSQATQGKGRFGCVSGKQLVAFLNMWVTNLLPVTSVFCTRNQHYYGTHAFDPRILRILFTFSRDLSGVYVPVMVSGL